MNMAIKNQFISVWKKYFNHSELPVTFFYHQTDVNNQAVKPGSGARCLIEALSEVRNGRSLTLNADSGGCFGGQKYLGFTQTISPNFEYFLSCGIPGKLEGERYKKSPELVREINREWPQFKAPAPFITFKRWDILEEEDEPEVVIFFALSDVLSGLFTLFNFDEAVTAGVIAPMTSGCAGIITYPYLEIVSPHPKAVFGMFDPSARPFVPKDVLTFSLPFLRFIRMVNNVDESFLITESWKMVQKRIV